MIRAAKNATKTIPIVMTGGGRSCRGRLIDKPCPTRRQRTGITTLTRELGGKRLELLKEAAPKAGPRRVSLRSDIRAI